MFKIIISYYYYHYLFVYLFIYSFFAGCFSAPNQIVSHDILNAFGGFGSYKVFF